MIIGELFFTGNSTAGSRGCPETAFEQNAPAGWRTSDLELEPDFRKQS